ncbi:Chromo/chromo shadow domain,RNA binding activity-knot of a chromodomain,Chromo domain-like [Cinara cedri]|uniref:Chromo/chromo shadow domain,RNA binding activity-knot of a chromodomain,Chromo domain-like n=1 Tax=Cinara cedri TaxID=506608 RepID=A0A5E4NND7_9HEMI|nr:Chromo/chromo shadow domain,RNA binding activity-knot of a chromodomain,Chromo domain-like [Cinara cedri]
MGDNVLCFCGQMLYEAKCLKRRKITQEKVEYLIHFKGWHSKWDEWVDAERVLAVNDVNMKKMASLKEIYSRSKKGAKKQSKTVIIKKETVQSTQKNTSPTVKGRKHFDKDLNEYDELSFLVIDGNEDGDILLLQHLRCASHTLSLLATTDFQNISKNSNAKKYNHPALSKCSTLWNLLQRLKSVITRCNSLYDSISQLIKHRAKLNTLTKELGLKYQLNETDLSYLTKFV